MYGVSQGLLGPLPSFEELENPQTNIASEVYSADGVLLGKYYYENRSNVTYEEISPNVINALIATEDIRFHEHAGIDVRGVVRAFIFMGSKGGASTITQQLAKNLFHHRPESLWERIKQKLKEWVIAVRLERNYTKREIITMYLNTVPFSGNAYGIKSASKTFFDKNPDSLTVEEAAVLIGMLKASTKYNPQRNPGLSQKRRNVVINQMAKYDFIKDAAADSLQKLPIVLNYSESDHNLGLAPYFREFLRQRLIRWSKENIKVDGTHYDIYKDGLKIYTTINAKMQHYAEEAVDEHIAEHQQLFFNKIKGRKRAPFDWRVTNEQIQQIMDQAIRRTDRYKKLKARGVAPDSIKKVFNTPVKMKVFTWKGEKDTVMSPLDSIRYYKHFLQAGFMVAEPATGHVKVWVGGVDHKHFKYDHVNKRARRQVGSTFKPFVYTTAVMNGYSPCYEVPNVPICLEKGTFGLLEEWCPENADREYGGMVTLKEGMSKSINTVSAFLMKQLGPYSVMNLAKKMGIESEHLQPVPSIALGTADISVYEMVTAYTTYPNLGFRTNPIFITRIEDKNGNLVQQFYPEKVEALNEETSSAMLNMFQYVAGPGGTAYSLRYKYKLYGEMGGKTGTSQNQSDAWFMGITPQLVGGVWTGWEDRSVHFPGLYEGQGAKQALPIWGLFLQKVYNDKDLNIDPEATFQRPKTPIGIELDCSKYEDEDGEGNPANPDPFGF